MSLLSSVRQFFCSHSHFTLRDNAAPATSVRFPMIRDCRCGKSFIMREAVTVNVRTADGKPSKIVLPNLWVPLVDRTYGLPRRQAA